MAGARRRIIANKGRKLQVQEAPGRKLFGAAEKLAFLDRFSQTCNASASARAVGFDYRTAFRHRREDSEFAAGWDEALALGYERLEELALSQAIAALDWEPPEPDDAPPAALKLDAAMALQLLREHRRGLAGIGKPGRAPGAATNDEVMDALIERLKAFGVRIGRDGAPL